MRKLLSAIILAAILITPLVDAPAARAQTVKPLPLSDCPFTIGIGEAKHNVDAKCGVLSVPEDYAHPDGRKIDLHVVVLPPLNPNAKGLPIFHLEGGPGGSAITNFGEGWYGAYYLLRQDHPVVLIDQRGTGRSASLQCTEITDAAFADLEKIITPADDKNATIQRLGECLARLSKTNDPRLYTSNALADDTDAVRAALGYDQIDVFGNSYGTWLGQIYLKRHGEHVAALVLDSVTGPWNYPDLDAANNGQAALDKTFTLCKADMACDKAFPDLPGQLKTAFAKLEANPVVVTGSSLITNAAHPVGMTAGRLRSALFQLLYNSANATLIPETINQAAHGGYLVPAGFLVTEAEQANESISLGLNYSVVCAESTAFYTDALIRKYQSDSVFRDLANAQDTIDTCKAWRSAELSAADVAPVQSDRPTLILSGALDPITPVKFGEETHARLSHSTLAVFPYQAHAVIANSKCGQSMVAAFLAAPDKPVDTRCTAKDLKPLFLGAYSIDVAPFADPNATFAGSAPKGWKAEQDGVLTFFSSPDGLQFAAAGIYKNQKPEAVKAAMLDQIRKRYGAVEVQQQLSVNMLIISITAVVHSMDRPGAAYIGTILLRPQGADTYAVWQAAPSNWFQAVSVSLTPQMLIAMRPRSG